MASSASSLSAPTDIPWRRVCVTSDMLDPPSCDLLAPPRWRPSIVVFRNDPPDELQPFPDARVTYLKVSVTLAPFVPELEVELGRRAADLLEEAFPCYGALLHVTLAPPEEARDGRDLRDFPYFVDFEPKQREPHEMVSKTGEVRSRSSSTLAVAKSAASTQSTEGRDIDDGTDGGGGEVGVDGQNGTASSELLFQAFHVGTNRALFLMEPRPHVREATFIDGPRALEGIQEVLLAVVRPRGMEELCVGALLETAHLGKEQVLEHETTTQVVELRLEAKAPNLDKSVAQDSGEGTKAGVAHFDAPGGWQIVGFDTTTLRSARVVQGPTVSHDGQHLTVTGEVGWRAERGGIKGGEREDIHHDGALDVDVAVKLRRKEPGVKEYVRSLFLSARQVCCCPKSADLGAASVTYERPLDRRIEVPRGPASPARMEESRRLTAWIRDEMVRSASSSSRVPVGARRYVETDTFALRVAEVVEVPSAAPMIWRDGHAPGARAPTSPGSRESDGGRAGDLVVGVDASTLLEAPAATTARRMRITEAEARQLRLRAIEALAADREE